MLILTVKPGQEVYIDGGRVVVTNCGRTRTRIGVLAPGLVVDRKEVHLRKAREQSDPDYTRPETSR